MRILSYNILDGGTGRESELVQVIAGQRPDVVALVEAEETATVARIAYELKMDFVQAIGNSHASALLTRWTIRDSINHALLRPGLSKSFLEATVVDRAGMVWPIAVVHLHARAFEEDEAKREGELGEILSAMERHRAAGRRHLICGDLNSNTPRQIIDLANATESTRQAWPKNGGHIPRRVVQAMLDHGYSDTLRTVNGRAADRMYSFKTEHPGQRVDYIFSYGIGAWEMRSAWVVRDELSRRASDHYPVGLEVVG